MFCSIYCSISLNICNLDLAYFSLEAFCNLLQYFFSSLLNFFLSQNAGASKKELPIVEEVTSVLREWGIIWKELYVVRIYICVSFLGIYLV